VVFFQSSKICVKKNRNGLKNSLVKHNFLEILFHIPSWKFTLTVFFSFSNQVVPVQGLCFKTNISTWNSFHLPPRCCNFLCNFTSPKLEIKFFLTFTIQKISFLDEGLQNGFSPLERNSLWNVRRLISTGWTNFTLPKNSNFYIPYAYSLFTCRSDWSTNKYKFITNWFEMLHRQNAD